MRICVSVILDGVRSGNDRDQRNVPAIQRSQSSVQIFNQSERDEEIRRYDFRTK